MNQPPAQERPWSEYEKVALLAEIIKQSRVTHGALMKVIVELDVQVRWDDLPLPDGRSLNSSKSAFDDMHKFRHFQPILSPFPQLGTHPGHPAPNIRKRPPPGSEMPNFPAIQPKPPGLNTAPYRNPQEGMFSFRSPGDNTEPPRKKRGRPSNAQIEVEKATAAAQGLEWKPRPTRQPRKKKAAAEQDTSPAADAPPSATIPQTPEVHMAEADEHEQTSSSAKRRRKHKEDPPVVRQPYDPVRQSPTEVAPSRGDMSPPTQGPVGPPSYQFQASDPDSGNASSTPKDI